ncbi:hypothetical protein L7F22_017287 [Adiantum nelumboides]|nr:hypothetical protein [Adiantum nelumboides]
MQFSMPAIAHVLKLSNDDKPTPCTAEEIHLSQRDTISKTKEEAGRAGNCCCKLQKPEGLQAAFNLGVLYCEGIFPEKGSSTLWKRETPLMLSHIPGLPPFISELLPSKFRFADLSNYFVQFNLQGSSCVKSGERILINSLLELEPAAFKSFEVEGSPAYAIGPLPTDMKMEDIDQTECLSWLDLQAESSVVYVAFGSFAKLSAEEIQELAMGLEPLPIERNGLCSNLLYTTN